MGAVTRCRLFINGTENRRFKNFNRDPEEHAKVVKLANGNDTGDINPEYTAGIDYVPETGKKEFDFKSAFDGTAEVKIAKIGGGAYVYSNVKYLGRGAQTISGEEESVVPILFYGESLVEE